MRIDLNGEILESFDTLVNPGRDVGPTHVHGITAAMVASAPRFADVAGDLLAMIASGDVLAGHNLAFDLRFLKAELARMGVAWPDLQVFCSCQELGRLNLGACGQEMGIPEDGEAHCALVDARRSARIAAAFSGGAASFVEDFGFEGTTLPAMEARGTAPVTRGCVEALPAPGDTYLRGLLGRLRHDPDDKEASEGYLALLTEVLEDRVVDEREAAMLKEAADVFDLNAERVSATHAVLLEALCDAALEDSLVTEAERRDLERVCQLLGEPRERLDPMLAAAANRRGLRRHASAAMGDQRAADRGPSLTGLRVCFSGTLQSLLGGERMRKPDAERLAEEAGLIVVKSVTKALDLLVVADPDTASGKAEKARRYGTRIMAEPAFWRAAGIRLTE